MKVAFLGLGAMGYPMAGHIAGRGFDLAVWNRTGSVAERFGREHPAKVLAGLETAAGLEVVVTCLPTSREVDEVAMRLSPRLAAGAIWVDCTSGDPATSRETAARLAAAGIGFLDAPVSGGLSGARDGRLTVMAGGDAEALQRATPVLSSFAARIVHVGAVGAGHALKAVNNTLLAAHLLVDAEGIAALRRNGISLERALEVLNASSGRSHVTEKLLPEPLARGEFPLTFRLALLDKDVGIGARLVREAGVEAPVTAATAARVSEGRRRLGDDRDYLELARLAGGD